MCWRRVRSQRCQGCSPALDSWWWSHPPTSPHSRGLAPASALALAEAAGLLGQQRETRLSSDGNCFMRRGSYLKTAPWEDSPPPLPRTSIRPC